MHRNKLHLIVDVLAYAAMACLVATGLIMFYRLPPGSGNKAILGYTRHEWGTIHFYSAIALTALVALHVALHWKWVTNTFGSLVRSRGVRRAGAGVGGAAILVAIGLAAAAVVALPWAFPVGTGAHRGDGGGQGKGYRGGRSASDAASPTADAAKEKGDETCDGTCPSDPAVLAERHGKGQGQGQGQGQGRGGGQGAEGIRGSTTLAEAAAEAGVGVERILAELKLPAATSPAETLGRLRQQHGFTMQDVREIVARLRKEKGNP